MICKDCHVDKPKDLFYARDTACKECRIAMRKQYYAANKEEHKIRCRKYYANNKEHLDELRRQYERKRRYGLTQQQYELLLEKQAGQCAICHSVDNGHKASLEVDHDHITGKVRGLLCNKCNQGIGLLQDSEALLKNAIIYLSAASDPE